MKRIILFLTLFHLTAISIYGQLKGVVKDQNGQPLVGVIIQSETGSSVTTDFDGYFEIDVPLGTNLSVSFLGYKSQNVSASSNMNIELRRKGAKPIKSTEDIPWSMFVLANGMSSYPFSPAVGLTIGMVKKGGWYLNAMMGFGTHFRPSAIDSYSNINNSDAPFFTGKNTCQTLSATIGGLARLGRAPMYWYLGAGYGYKSITYETNNKKWIAYQTKPTSDWSPMHGLAIETGFLANIKGFSLSFGYEAILGIANPVNAVSVAHEFKIGLGGMFNINRRANK